MNALRKIFSQSHSQFDSTQFGLVENNPKFNFGRIVFYTLISPIIICVCSYVYLSHTGYYTPIDIPIQKHPFTINEQETVFEFDPPLTKRKRSAASVNMTLEDKWDTNPPWDVVEFTDGRKAAIRVTLTSVENEDFKSTILGSGGKGLNVRFDLPDPKMEIKKIKIVSDIPVKCSEARWYDFHYK